MKTVVSTGSRSSNGRGSPDCGACPASDLCKVSGVHYPFAATLVERLGVLSVDAHSMLVAEGEPDGYAFFIAEGVARASASLPDGRRQVSRFLLPGDLHLPGTGRPSAVSVEAASPVVVCRIRADEMSDCEARVPQLRAVFHRDRLDQLDAARRHMLLLGRKTALEKVASFILEVGSIQASRNMVSEPVAFPMGRQDVADYLGLTLETVSREFSHLKARGLIEVVGPHHVALLQRNSLEGVANGAGGSRDQPFF